MIISRNYRGDVPQSAVEKFMLFLQDEEESMNKPVMHLHGVTFAYIIYNNLYLVAASKRNANSAMIFKFLYKLVEVMKVYFKELEEESIRDNFVIIYELLDEMMDFGYPQSTETSILQQYITT